MGRIHAVAQPEPRLRAELFHRTAVQRRLVGDIAGHKSKPERTAAIREPAKNDAALGE